MQTHNAGSAKIAILRGHSWDDGWFGWATLLLLGSVVVYGLLCVPANAQGVQPPPTRNANIYDGFDHQPTRSEVEARERAAGISSNTGRQSSDNSVEQLYQQLMMGTGHNG